MKSNSGKQKTTGSSIVANSHQIELFTKVRFAAAHSYNEAGLSPDENWAKYGKCSKVHGHNFEAIIGLRGKFHPQTGMLVNFFDVEKVLQEIITAPLDYCHLEKDIPFFGENIPTTENIARYLFINLENKFGPDVELFRVELFESFELGAVYERNDHGQ
jgi:6-pyruvoyltetrahydropterin/6-carboxytetrahydropterin synthase